MAVSLDSLVDLAVSTVPQSQVNLSHLNDLLHNMVRWMAASKSISADAAGKLPPLLDGTSTSAGTQLQARSADGVDGSDPVTGASADGHSGSSDVHTNSSGSSEQASGRDSGVGSPCLYALSEGAVKAMENKLKALENRLDTLQSLDELQKRAADGATPAADMWNFATINKRLDAAEEGVAKVCSMMDELAKELHKLRQDGQKKNEELEEKLQGMADDLALLQGSGSADANASRNKLQSLVDDLNSLKSDVNDNFAKCEDLEDLVTWQALEDCLKNRIPEPPPPVASPEPPPMTRRERVQSAKKATPSREAMDALLQVGALSGKHKRLVEEVEELENAISGKLTAADIANLAPKESAELVASLQARVAALEDQIGKDMKKEFDEMKELVNMLKSSAAVDAEKMATILNSHSENEQLVQDMSAQMIQLREQLSMLERTLDALQAASQQQSAAPAQTLDPELVEGFKSQVGGLSEEQKLLHNALEQLLRDLSESKQHIENLYQGVDNLNQVKADKEFVALEVEDKADRQLLDDKASRVWVDNHIHQLTQEILNAKDHVSGQDERLQDALDRLTSDVDSKLDRLEIEPLKQYLESKIKTSAVRPSDDGEKQEGSDWNAAGMRRALLKFHCISCDRPVLMKADGPVNALPIARGMRPQRIAVRPADIHELQAMREQQRRFVSGLDGGPPSSYLPTFRSCGGGHTLTHPTRRARIVPDMAALYNSAPDPMARVSAIPGGEESDIVGQNGQVYRGRAQRGGMLPQLPHQAGKVGLPAKRPSRSAKSSRPAHPEQRDDGRPVSSMDLTLQPLHKQ